MSSPSDQQFSEEYEAMMELARKTEKEIDAYRRLIAACDPATLPASSFEEVPSRLLVIPPKEHSGETTATTTPPASADEVPSDLLTQARPPVHVGDLDSDFFNIAPSEGTKQDVFTSVPPADPFTMDPESDEYKAFWAKFLDSWSESQNDKVEGQSDDGEAVQSATSGDPARTGKVRWDD